MMAIAREKLALHPRPGLQFGVADADATVAKIPHYDAILAFSVLHLVQDLWMAPQPPALLHCCREGY